MMTLDTLRQEKRAEILKLAAQHGVCNVRVYGSIARGDNREDSDIDFLVDMEQGRNLFDLAGFLGDVQDLLGVRVDITTTNSLRYLRDRVLAEAKVL